MQNDELGVLRRRYVRYLRLERGYSDNTVEAYTHDIDYLLNYLRNENLKVEDVKLEHLQNFAAVIYEFGIASSSQARILCGVRSFFKYLVIDRILRDDPSELLEAPSVGEHLPEVLSTEEVDRMEAAIDLSKWEGQRNRAIIEVLFSCGLRVSELVNLKFNDVFEREKFLRIIGKGDKERLVPISDTALHEIRLWRTGLCLPQQARSPPHAHHDTDNDKAHCRRRRHNQDGVATYAATLIRYRTAQGRRRPQGNTGNAGPRKH